MRFAGKAVTIRDGREAVLRAPDAGEALELLAFLRDTAEETEFLLRSPEECTMTLDEERRFIGWINDSPDNMMIVCTVEGELAGNCQISFMKKRKTMHRASVAIALRRKFWGLGIGTMLMTELVAAARERGIRQIELEFVEGNHRARALYEKLGFRLVGMRPNAYRLSDGGMRHEYIMVKEL